ncbi:MAG: aldo/keto reductase family protein [bacterium]|jgi:voltage-dependent potassium channel beta subunit
MVNHPDMEYRSLGKCGLKVSQYSLGGWTTFGQSVKELAEVKRILFTAFDRGINFFDIADVYGKGEAERVMGKALGELPRNELIISSKVFFPYSNDVNDRGLSRKHIMESIQRSLKNIGTDYLDLYFCHRFDQDTPLEETARAMDDLVHQGKVLYWGTSEWNGSQIQEIHRLCRELNLYRPQVEQPRYSLLLRRTFEQDVRPAALEHGMGLVTFSPLTFGFLTGKYDDGIPEESRLYREEWLRERVFTEENFARVKRMKSLSERLGCSRAQLALAWTSAQAGVGSVITGATRVEQLQENLDALKIRITEDIQQELTQLFPAGE